MLQEFEVTPEAAAALQVFQQENASEIAAEKDKPFELTKEEETATPETASDGPAASAGMPGGGSR